MSAEFFGRIFNCSDGQLATDALGLPAAVLPDTGLFTLIK